MRGTASCLTSAVLAALSVPAVPAVGPDRTCLATARGRPEEHPMEDLRTAAAQALGLVPAMYPGAELAEWVLTDEKAVRAAGAKALGHIGLPAAAPALKRALKDTAAGSCSRRRPRCYESKDPVGVRSLLRGAHGRTQVGRRTAQSQLELLKDPQALAKSGSRPASDSSRLAGSDTRRQGLYGRQDLAGARGGGAQTGERPRPENRAGAGLGVERRQVDGPRGRGERARPPGTRDTSGSSRRCSTTNTTRSGSTRPRPPSR